MKKKIILGVVIAVCLVATLGTLYAMVMSLGGFKHTYENFGYLISEKDEIIIVQYTDKQGVSDVTIPEEIDGKPVVTVKDFAFVNTDQVKTIRIGKSVKEISDWSFTNNVNLERFVVDAENPNYKDLDGVLFTKDGKTLMCYPNFHMTAEDNKAAPYVIPEGVETISGKAFYKCNNVFRVTFPSSLRYINEGAFLYTEQLENISLPQGLLRIEKDAFSYCSRIGSRTVDGSYADDVPVVLPASLEYVGDYAFYNAVYIKSLVVNKPKAFTEEKWGYKWFPVQNGDVIGDCVITYQ